MTATTRTKFIIHHPAASRGHADHGWLDTWHSFSFGGWHNPERMHFGALRVLNDDTVAAGMGFGSHPHDNMEIISLVTEGALRHKDSMGHEGLIQAGEVQAMSAGTGVVHSEFNPNAGRVSKFFQIWILPKERNTAPRYQQHVPDPLQRQNRFQQIVSPCPEDAGLWIGQDAWLHWGRFDGGRKEHHAFQRTGNGIYAMAIAGSATINGHVLGRRDALGVVSLDALDISIGSEGAELLLIEVPMHLNR